MAPKSNIVISEDPLSLNSEYVEDIGNELEERKIQFNISTVVNDLKNLDYSKVVWRNVILFCLLHLYSGYGLYLGVVSAQWKTVMFCAALYFLSALGITMGAHRLWAHRSYKARFPLRVFLAFLQTMAFQNDIYDWSRDHRAHHKFSETDGDPHNAKRGFFFCHMGWLMYRKHPDVISKGKTIKMDDILSDPIVRFQRKYYKSLLILVCFIFPTVVPRIFWGENLYVAFMVPGILRYVITLHVTWLVNSLAHWIGAKPFERTIYPAQNRFVATFALGEGWHNYHHVFPFDYRAAEMSGIFQTNVTATLIDFCQKIGLAYDLKIVDNNTLLNRARRTGDGSHQKQHNH